MKAKIKENIILMKSKLISEQNIFFQQITSVIHNPANQAQSYNFGFVMPNDALVSDVSIIKAKAGTFENLPNTIDNANAYGSSVNTSNFMNLLESAIQEGDEDKIEELISERFVTIT